MHGRQLRAELFIAHATLSLRYRLILVTRQHGVQAKHPLGLHLDSFEKGILDFVSQVLHLWAELWIRRVQFRKFRRVERSAQVHQRVIDARDEFPSQSDEILTQRRDARDHVHVLQHLPSLGVQSHCLGVFRNVQV